MSVLFIGCDAGAPPLGSLPPGDRVQLEPGDVSPQMSSSPAIEIYSSGGFAGSGWGNFHIWEDGTVAAECPDGSHRHGKMSPARVRAVIDTLEAGRFFKWSSGEGRRCPDAMVTSLKVQRGHASNTVVDSSCDSSRISAQAIKLVMQSIAESPRGM